MKPVGLLGGTFDPIHIGHLRLALELKSALDLAEVRFIPLHSPPHRAPPRASPQQRLRMLELALDGVPGLSVDARELQRAGISYTVETLQSLRAEVGNTPVCLLMGMDAFRLLRTWHRWNDLLEYAHLAVAKRPGMEPDNLEASLAALLHRRAGRPVDLHAQPAGLIVFQDIPQLDVSASHIRAEIARGREPHFLVPEPVLAYIQQERLYH
jgi:nicotinate-nucleotide adenylyltransferase